MKLFTIPNILTLGNLACGCIAIVCAFNGDLVWSAYLVGIAAVLDFLDGFVARALKQHSPIGKDLDSLADMVTFGVVPGVVMYRLLELSQFAAHLEETNFDMKQFGSGFTTGYFIAGPLSFIAFLITLFSALRLAKFNNDTRQSDSFIGVPTPANSILVCSFALILNAKIPAELSWPYVHSVAEMHAEPIKALLLNPWFLTCLVIVMSYLLIAELPLFALKFKSFRWKGNELRFSFLAVSVILLVLLKYIALPLIIMLYILLSVINNLVTKKKPGA